MLIVALLVAQAAPNPAPPPASGAKPKLHCEWEEVTGSRFARKVCLTEEQRAARREAAMRAAAEIINRPKTQPAGE